MWRRPNGNTITRSKQPSTLFGKLLNSSSKARSDSPRLSSMAQVFYAKGLRPGDVCAIAMENRPQFFFS